MTKSKFEMLLDELFETRDEAAKVLGVGTFDGRRGTIVLFFDTVPTKAGVLAIEEK